MSLLKWRSGLALLGIACGWGMDQWTKTAIRQYLYLRESASIEITSFFDVVGWWNRGSLFGIGHEGGLLFPNLLILFNSLLLIGIFWAFLKASSGWMQACWTLLLAGGLGNLTDRLYYGAVFDFLYFHWGDWGWPAFNVADIGVCLGIAGLLAKEAFYPTASASPLS